MNTGPSRKRNPAVGVLVDALAGDVGRHQVGRELHPGEAEVEGGGKRPGQEGLGHARHPLEQDVARYQQGCYQPADHRVLTDYDLGHLAPDGHDRLPRAYWAGRPWVNLWRSFH